MKAIKVIYPTLIAFVIVKLFAYMFDIPYTYVSGYIYASIFQITFWVSVLHYIKNKIK